MKCYWIWWQHYLTWPWHSSERVTCNIIITFCIIKIIYLNLPQIVLFLESVFRRRTGQWMTSVLKTKTTDKYNHLSLNWWPLRPSGISICLYWDCSTHNPSIEQLFCNTSNLPACLKHGYNIEQMPPNMSEKTDKRKRDDGRCTCLQQMKSPSRRKTYLSVLLLLGWSLPRIPSAM